jgi:hypothetical protein
MEKDCMEQTQIIKKYFEFSDNRKIICGNVINKFTVKLVAG